MSDTVTLYVRQTGERAARGPVLTNDDVGPWVGHTVTAHLGFDWRHALARLRVDAAGVQDGDIILTCAVLAHSAEYDHERLDQSEVGVGIMPLQGGWMLHDLAPVWSLP